MKKNLLKVMAMSCALSLTLAFTGCGSDAGSSSEAGGANSSEAQVESSSEASVPAESSADASEAEESSEAISLADFLNSDEIKEATESASSDEYTCTMYADGDNVMVMSYTFTQQLDLSNASVKDQMAQTIDDGLEAQASVFTELRDTYREELSIPNMVLRIEYLNNDGTEIFTKDFE